MFKSNFYGPFVRSSEKDKWHWREECPDFPKKNNPQNKISTAPPDKDILCSVCYDIEMKSPQTVLEYLHKNK